MPWEKPDALSCGEVPAGGEARRELSFVAPGRGTVTATLIEGSGVVSIGEPGCRLEGGAMSCVLTVTCRPSGPGVFAASIVLGTSGQQTVVPVTGTGYGRLIVELDGDGAGVVRANDGQTCTSRCELRYQAPALTLQAEPTNDATFVGFDGVCTGKRECIPAEVGRSARVRATFRKPTFRTLPLSSEESFQDFVGSGEDAITCIRDRKGDTSIRRFAGDGAVRWSSRLTTPTTPRSTGCAMVVGPSGDIWVSTLLISDVEGESGQYLRRLSATGETLASIFLKNELSFWIQGSPAVAANEQGAAMTGYTTAHGTMHPYVRRVADDGRELWAVALKQIRGSGLGAAMAKDGTVYAALQQTNATGPDNAVLVRLDPSGHVVWQRTFSSGRDVRDSFQAVVLTGDDVVVTGSTQGSFAHATDGYLTVRKYTSDGELVWARSYGDRNDANRPSRIVANHSGEIFVLAMLRDGIQIRKLGSDGSLLWSRTDLPAPATRISPLGRGIALDKHGNLVVSEVELGSESARLWTFYQ